MCGIEEYSIADFKANHVVNGSSPEFRRVLYWFWTAVSNFTGNYSQIYCLLCDNSVYEVSNLKCNLFGFLNNLITVV